MQIELYKHRGKCKDDLRSRVDFHRRNLLTAPAHGLKRRIVIAHLKLASHHVLTLIQGDFTITVVLVLKEDKKVYFERFARYHRILML